MLMDTVAADDQTCDLSVTHSVTNSFLYKLSQILSIQIQIQLASNNISHIYATFTVVVCR